MSKKKLLFHEKGKWSESGYNADVILFIEGEAETQFQGSTWPNPIKPRTNLKLSDAYGAIQEGKYTAQFGRHAHNNRPGFNIENNSEIPTLNPNPNQNGRMVADHVDIHQGYSDSWRGSAACLTIMPFYWEDFIAAFEDGEEVKLEVKRDINTVS